MISADLRNELLLCRNWWMPGAKFIKIRFCAKVFACAERRIVWEGLGLEEVCRDAGAGQVLIQIDPLYFRPSEVHDLLGDGSKAHRPLGWSATTKFDALLEEMLQADLCAA